MTQVAPRGAPASLRALSISVDAVLVVVCAGAGFVLVAPAPWAGALGAGVVVLAVLLVWRAAWGSSVGHEVARLRAVWPPSGLPAPVWRQPQRSVRRADGDPLRILPRAVSLDTAPAPRAQPVRAPAGGLRLIMDDGTVHAIETTGLVGRSPSADQYAGAQIVPVPDVRRTISRTHLLLEDGGDVVYATDLGGVGGTRVAGGSRLTVGERTPLAWDTTLFLGERALTLRHRFSQEVRV